MNGFVPSGYQLPPPPPSCPSSSPPSSSSWWSPSTAAVCAETVSARTTPPATSARVAPTAVLDRSLPAAFAFAGSSDDGIGIHGGATATSTVSGGRECAVCLGTVSDDEMVRRLRACKHVYHAECIDRWLAAHRTCPLCRSELHPCKDPLDQLPV